MSRAKSRVSPRTGPSEWKTRYQQPTVNSIDRSIAEVSFVRRSRQIIDVTLIGDDRLILGELVLLKRAINKSDRRSVKNTE